MVKTTGAFASNSRRGRSRSMTVEITQRSMVGIIW